MPTPFGADTWVTRTPIPNILLNGVYSGLVQGPISAVYDPESRVIQSFSKLANHFEGFASTAQISFNDGGSWAESFNEGLNNRVAFQGWSLASPGGSGRVHFQVRYDFHRAFLLADGTLQPGGIYLMGSEGGASFFKLQDFHTWPGINEIGGNGGAALFNFQPTVTRPVTIPGSGPDGEDAMWLVSSFSLEAGGASNRTTFEKAMLWKSIDGGVTWLEARDMSAVTGVQPYQEMVYDSRSGRLFLVSGGGGPIFWTDDSDDLGNAAWTTSVFSGASGQRGSLVTMFGGTLFTFSQGTLTGPGGSWVSCDNGENFQTAGQDVVPQNQTGFMTKLGPTEALVVAPGFANPTTETVSYYTADGGESFLVSDPWLSSVTGESPVMVAVRLNGTPIVVTRNGSVFVSSSTARGVADPRVVCPLANAGLGRARRLVLCGGVITPDCQE